MRYRLNLEEVCLTTTNLTAHLDLLIDTPVYCVSTSQFQTSSFTIIWPDTLKPIHTFLITVYFPQDNMACLWELGSHEICCLVEYGGQHATEAAPVCVEVHYY
uniref:Uncharacterized protein n=1 Tax=Timema douglasi TaxID=61478 RepID=A0A7R8ZBS7_TIMDO|nr:unnamed protein product [Timema douglasi]